MEGRAAGDGQRHSPRGQQRPLHVESAVRGGTPEDGRVRALLNVRELLRVWRPVWTGATTVRDRRGPCPCRGSRRRRPRAPGLKGHSTHSVGTHRRRVGLGSDGAAPGRSETVGEEGQLTPSAAGCGRRQDTKMPQGREGARLPVLTVPVGPETGPHQPALPQSLVSVTLSLALLRPQGPSFPVWGWSSQPALGRCPSVHRADPAGQAGGGGLSIESGGKDELRAVKPPLCGAHPPRALGPNSTPGLFLRVCWNPATLPCLSIFDGRLVLSSCPLGTRP